MKTFTLLFSGSQISPFKFLEQRSVSAPCSQPFASLLRFINPSFTPTSHPAQAPGPLFLEQPVFPFWEYLLGYCKGKGRDVKRKKSPPKQLTCCILLWSGHQQPTTFLSETLNNRVFSISHLQVGIFEAQETLKMKDGKTILQADSQLEKTNAKLSSPKLQFPVLLWIKPMGMFQPAVLPTAVWHDFLPCRLFHVISLLDFFTTATAK